MNRVTRTCRTAITAACALLLAALLAPMARSQTVPYWNPVPDQFSYSNGNLTGNGNWATQTSHVTLTVASNQIECTSIGSTDCGNTNNNGSWPNDQCSEVQVITLNTTMGGTFEVGVRASLSADTYYAAFVKGPLGASAQVQVNKVITGTVTQLVPYTAVSINSGDYIAFCAHGTTLYVSIGGRLVSAFNTTDGSITSGVPKIGIESNGQAATDVVLGRWLGFWLLLLPLPPPGPPLL